MGSTEQVLDHHLDCFGRGDLTASLPTIRRRPSCSRREGHYRDRLPFAHSFRRSLRSSENLERRFPYSYGALTATADILWRAETADNTYETVADTFVVQNGQIILHSFGGKIQAKNTSIP